MPALTDTDGLTDLQRDIVAAVREFTEAEIIPVAGDLDRTDTYPDQIVAGLRELGVFGLTISPQYGGLGESPLTYALVAEEIARGWMSPSGIINTHFIVAYLIARHGTAEQKASFLPKMATGEGSHQLFQFTYQGALLGQEGTPQGAQAVGRRAVRYFVG